MNTKVIAAISAAGLLAVVGAGCGDDDDEAGNTERYCELVGELEEAGTEVFADVPEDASGEEIVAAEAEFVEMVGDELDEMVEVAPEEIAEDVETYIDDLRARAAGESGEDVGEAEERILAFEEENC